VRAAQALKRLTRARPWCWRRSSQDQQRPRGGERLETVMQRRPKSSRRTGR
jgi:hypothetical protein